MRLFLAFFIGFFFAAQSQGEELLVKLKPEAKSVMSAFGTTIGVKTLKNDDSIIIVEGDIEEFRKNPMVEHVEVNYTIKIDPIPSDVGALVDRPDKVWGIQKIKTDEVLAKGVKPSPDVVVAVIDTGVDYKHPELKDSIWVNSAEIAGNEIDDDGNGYVDDIHGYDFVNDDGDPMDDNIHGTHVAGTIAGKTVGVAPGISIMALKFLSASGSGSLSDALDAIKYATKNGAHIMNNSWGGGGYSQLLADAIEEAEQAGIVFVAAAGNSRADNDRTSAYPANYEFSNVISVAATTESDSLAYFSNYGAKKVHVAAPGLNIYSAVPNGAYRTLNGTSMAAPHVAGAAALFMSHDLEVDHECIRESLVSESDEVSYLRGKSQSNGRVNLLKTFEAMF